MCPPSPSYRAGSQAPQFNRDRPKHTEPASAHHTRRATAHRTKTPRRPTRQPRIFQPHGGAKRPCPATVYAVDNQLAHMDQVSFLGVRALGYGALVQFEWIYNRPVNIEGLRRFHRNLGYGLL